MLASLEKLFYWIIIMSRFDNEKIMTTGKLFSRMNAYIC